MINSGALVATLLAASALGPHPDAVAGFNCQVKEKHRNELVLDVMGAYDARSAEIIQASLDRDFGRLARMVAPTAEFTIFHGDVGNGPRIRGPKAAVEFAKQLAATDYAFTTSAGPLLMDVCGTVIAELTVTGRDKNEATIIRFEFLNGTLIKATGAGVKLTRGKFHSGAAQKQ
jgi:hypothetical protein